MFGHQKFYYLNKIICFTSRKEFKYKIEVMLEEFEYKIDVILEEFNEYDKKIISSIVEDPNFKSNITFIGYIDY